MFRSALTTLLGLAAVFCACVSADERLQNISTRGLVRTGDEVMIGGFIITGSVDKTVLIRARGTSLVPFLPAGAAMADPSVELFNSAGAQLQTNNNWQDHPRAGEIDAALAPTESLEAAILVTLAPGAYTAIVRGVGDTTGVAIVEVFETDTMSRLENISTRGYVGTVDDVMIGGFIIDGEKPKTVVIRGRGPSLADFLEGEVGDTELVLFSGSDQIDFNDNFGTHVRANELPSQYVPTNSSESVIMTTLAPGLTQPTSGVLVTLLVWGLSRFSR